MQLSSASEIQSQSAAQFQIVPSEKQALWASASDQDGPGSIHDVFLVYGLTEGCLKSATVPESVLFTEPVPAFSSVQLLLRLKQHRAGNIRFQLRIRSRQLGSVNIGFQRGQRLFFASSKGEKLQDQTALFQVQVRSKASLSSIYLISLRVQIEPLKNMHIRLKNHQPLRASHLILQELISN